MLYIQIYSFSFAISIVRGVMMRSIWGLLRSISFIRFVGDGDAQKTWHNMNKGFLQF